MPWAPSRAAGRVAGSGTEAAAGVCTGFPATIDILSAREAAACLASAPQPWRGCRCRAASEVVLLPAVFRWRDASVGTRLRERGALVTFDRSQRLGNNARVEADPPDRPRPDPAARRAVAARRNRPRLGAARWLRPLGVASLAALVATASAEPLLHEYIELGPGDGPIEPAAMGELGASARSAPDGAGASAADGAAAEATAPSADSTFSIDRDTSRPERVSYADPFTPTVVPFKRSIVYDAVNREGELLVRSRELVDVPTLAGPRPNDEHFHASFELDLIANERTPIPSVAPGARLVLVNREPRTPLRIGADSAENWFVTATSSRHVRLTLQIVADRRVFGSSYPDVSWAALTRALAPLPPDVKRSALDVARALGIDEAARPARVVAGLVEHFRRFSASERRPTSQGLALYRELALTARGICRHRAYAFMITALGLGVPTRVAMNEAHAWVEVFDGELWHRIDLGGAADELDMDDRGRPRHVEPRDPFSWPDRRESGLAMAERRASTEGAAPGTGATDAPASPEPPAGSAEAQAEPGAEAGEAEALAADPEAPPEPGPAAPAQPDEPASEPELPLPGDVRLYTGAARAERGKSLLVSGSVQSGGQPCSGARVDVSLGQPEGPALALGSLVSDARGEFRGTLVIPWNAALGDHALNASASGCTPRLGVR
jgi:hypothetical protein